MSEIEIEPKSSRWSAMKTWSLVGMALPGVALVVTTVASFHYTGRVPTNALFWLFVTAIVVSAIAHVGAHIRDSLAANQERICNQINGRLSRIEERITNLETDVSQYGDRREVSGQLMAAQVVNGHPIAGSRRRAHLMPVDE